ncbi:TerC family protein [Fictibacillus sp. Mic-4]|uniref:TerC family protein n=1 Tax=Fictibacillus sp. Mic-4 TaxID=3132826 RepID=UPI003CFBA3D2
MEIVSMEFLTALFSIVVIDLVLAGDNAIVIGLAARNLREEQQKKVIVLGTLGAVVIRVFATLAVVWLLKVPGLLLVGGLMLIYIGFKLMTEEKDHDIEAKDNIVSAIITIIVADAAMGLDNVLAVAGAAHGGFLLVVLGLFISVPIVVWGSTIFIKLIVRFPFIITLGAAVIAWTAGKMIVEEPFLKEHFKNENIKHLFELLIIAFVVITGYIKKYRKQSTHPKSPPM